MGLPNTRDIEFNNEVDLVSSSLYYSFLKRIVDIIFSLIGLIMLTPLFIVVGILIKAEDSNGPIIFRQKRIGKDGTEFEMYKFRSMVSNAESVLESLLEQNEVTGLMFKMKDDPRVTKIGKFIRKYSIDELPQLWNVLKGDMSLVGPRPPLPREVAEYNEYHKQRLLVTPGCTGLWQISGRSNIGFEQMVTLDLRYIKERSIKNDFVIILKTAGQIITGKDAY